MLVLFIHITRLTSKEISPPSNKINREAGWAKDISAPRVLTLCPRTDTAVQTQYFPSSVEQMMTSS
jgi:hypothetical protein